MWVTPPPLHRGLCWPVNPLVQGRSSTNAQMHWREVILGKVTTWPSLRRAGGTGPWAGHQDHPTGGTTQPLMATSSPDLPLPPHLQHIPGHGIPQPGLGIRLLEGAQFPPCCRAVLFLWKFAQRALPQPIPAHLLKPNELWELKGTTDPVKFHPSQHPEPQL